MSSPRSAASATVSKTRTPDMADAPETRPAAGAVEPAPPKARRPRNTGSRSQRMIGIAAVWITLLRLGGGLALDRVLSSAITRNFDDSLEYVLTAMIASAEIGPGGEVLLNRPLGDQRFLEPYSGLYY